MGDRIPNRNPNINGISLPPSLPLWHLGLHTVYNHDKCVNTEIPENQGVQRADSHFFNCILSLLSQSQEFQCMGDRAPNSPQTLLDFSIPDGM